MMLSLDRTRPRASGSGARRGPRRASTIRNVCQIYEVGEDDGQLFIAMELLEGEPLGATA